MTNLFDSIAQSGADQHTDHRAPDWIEALSHSGGFSAGFGAFCAPNAPAQSSQPQAAEEKSEEFRAGEASARAAAEQEKAAQAERTRGLRLRFSKLDSEAMAALAADLEKTVVELCESVLGPIAHDPQALAERCEEAARRIGEAAAQCTLYLNEDDIALLDPEFAQDWRIVADDTIEPGGLRLEGSAGAVRDGPREWREAIAGAIRP